MVWKTAHVVLPATQDMQESRTEMPSTPPQTTNLLPDRRERLWLDLGLGRSRTEQAEEGGRGNNSTEERMPSPQPPTISCPDTDLFVFDLPPTDQKRYFDNEIAKIIQNNGKILNIFSNLPFSCIHIEKNPTISYVPLKVFTLHRTHSRATPGILRV